MLCGRCKTVETIRITFPANRCLDSRGRYLAQSVERCPSCDLEWRDVPIDYVVAAPVFDRNLRNSQGELEMISPEVRSKPVQVTLF